MTALTVSLLFTAPVYTASGDSDGIHSRGEVIEAPYEIHPEDINRSIDLRQVTTTRIDREHHNNKMAVDIRLINCDLSISDSDSGTPIPKAGIVSDSTAKTVGATPLSSNTSADEATEVGVRLMGESDGNVVLDLAASDLDLDVSSSEQTLDFFTWMKQIDSAVGTTAGEVTTNATYVLDHKQILFWQHHRCLS